MLFIDDHEPQILDRRKDRKSGPDNDVRRSGSNATPLVEALSGRQTGVNEADLGIEIRAQSIHDRQGQRDFRHQDQRSSAGFEACCDRIGVDRRLAATRNAIEECGRRVPCRDGRSDRGSCDRLLGRQIADRRSRPAAPGRPSFER